MLRTACSNKTLLLGTTRSLSTQPTIVLGLGRLRLYLGLYLG